MKKFLIMTTLRQFARWRESFATSNFLWSSSYQERKRKETSQEVSHTCITFSHSASCMPLLFCCVELRRIKRHRYDTRCFLLLRRVCPTRQGCDGFVLIGRAVARCRELCMWGP